MITRDGLGGLIGLSESRISRMVARLAWSPAYPSLRVVASPSLTVLALWGRDVGSHCHREMECRANCCGEAHDNR